MTGETHSQGVFSQILFEPGASPHTFDANSEIYEYHNHNIRKEGRIIGGNGIRGTRSRFKLRHREGVSWFHGSIHMYISPADFVTLLPKMIGDSVSGTTFSLAEDIPYFGILEKLDYNTMQIKDCKIDEWVLRSRAPAWMEEGEPDMLYLSLKIFGSDRTKGTTWPATPPTFGTNAANEPYVISDCDAGVTILGSVRAIEEFVLAGKNFLEPKVVNSLLPHSIMPTDRKISFTVRVPWNSANNDLDGQNPDGAAGSIAFTNGSVSTTFNFANMHTPERGPTPERGKHQISLVLESICTATGTADNQRELQIINDSTP